jgi:hypothetical protein
MGLLAGRQASAQGKVVINEYLPWTSNGCGATAEFVELMNFGPGPMNIGCYILTDGDYSVTIPPGTILQPGQFYVIAGQSTIPQGCANIDSFIHVNLNWNTCGCTSGPIPTTGDGFFTDGGAANEQVVLMDPNLNVIDAVVRDFPVEPSTTITTPAIGSCGSKTFNLDLMTVKYETLGMSTGRGNSFARKLDGDCGWVKDPQQSGNATNNTPSDVSEVSYALTIVKSMDCDASHGSIDIYVNVGTWTGELFPMNYTIAYDADQNNIFDFSDVYTYGVDSTPPSIAITGLPLGRYRITVGSVNGCFLQTFNVSILMCNSALDGRLVSFELTSRNNQSQTFDWVFGNMDDISTIQLEGSSNSSQFTTLTTLNSLEFRGARSFTQVTPPYPYTYYRLKYVLRSGQVYYSPVLNTALQTTGKLQSWPNPVHDQAHFRFESAEEKELTYQVYASNGMVISQGTLQTRKGANEILLAAAAWPKGIYHFTLFDAGRQKPISIRFVKQ